MQVVHGARLDHGEAELVVAAPVAVPQLHGEGDGLGARAPVRVVSSVVPQVVLSLGYYGYYESFKRRLNEVRKDFTSTRKVPTRSFSWMKLPTSAFSFKTLLNHYPKQ